MSGIAALYPTTFLRQYVKRKTETDPLYEAVLDRLRDSSDPILDAGCGIGVLAAFLRARGVRVPIAGIDRDAKKIDVARRAVTFDDVRFDVGDVRDLPEWSGTIVLLDVLHYVDAATQARILERAARTAKTVIIRDALRDGSWRYRITVAQERFSRAIGWLRSERLEFPTHENIVRPFSSFETEVIPTFGRTPFNNYLFFFRRRSVLG